MAGHVPKKSMVGKKMTEPTSALADFSTGIKPNNIPASTQEHTKLLLLDALACAYAGHKGE